MAMITRKQIEQASVVFKQIEFGETYEVLKTRDSQLSLGGKYSEDLVKYYALMNEKVVLVDTGEEVIEEEQSLKVGDYAKVINNHNTAPKFPLGTIIAITQEHVSGESYRYETLNGKQHGYVYAFRLVRATDEEVAEAKRQQAEELERKGLERKWAKIGRKPYEFKQGDIVKDTDGKFGYNYRSVLAVNGGYIRCMGGIDMYRDKAKLITPVEHRFDLPVGDSE
jgi:hypothetical protein